MNKVVNFALAVLPVVVGIWVASLIPNPLAGLAKKS